MKMLRELRAADKEVAGWRKLMQEILACEQRDLEGFVTTRRDKVREASPFLTPSASEQWSVGGHEADTHTPLQLTLPSRGVHTPSRLPQRWIDPQYSSTQSTNERRRVSPSSCDWQLSPPWPVLIRCGCGAVWDSA
jgi:hypothetical protein